MKTDFKKQSRNGKNIKNFALIIYYYAKNKYYNWDFNWNHRYLIKYIFLNNLAFYGIGENGVYSK